MLQRASRCKLAVLANVCFTLLLLHYCNNYCYCHCRGGGGAIAASATASLKAAGCTFAHNTAAPQATSHSSTSNSNDNSIITNKNSNSQSHPDTLSGEGGALLVSGAQAQFERCQFAENSCTAGRFDAGCAGGAASVSGELAQVVFTECEFSGNAAHGSAGSSGKYAASGVVSQLLHTTYIC
jgi:hypothetical protein